MSRAAAQGRIFIFAAAADAARAADAAGALAGLAPLAGPSDGPVAEGDCVLVVWTAAAQADAGRLQPLLAGAREVVAWRADGTPAPDWLAHATPVGPDMTLRALRLVAMFVSAEAARRARPPAPVRRAWSRKAALTAGAVAAVALAAAGLQTWIASTGPGDTVAAAPPVQGLRGLQ